MNTVLEQIEVKAEAIPFPHNVNTPCQNLDVQMLAGEIVSSARDKNNLLANAGNVHLLIRDHYVDPSSGTYGIESLIARILATNGAVFPKGIEKTQFRKVAIATAMFASDIIAEVRTAFGADRYPDQTIYTYLAHFMKQKNTAHKIGKIKLSNNEDKDRNCCKPRTKYYLVEITNQSV